jgi:hypothetical protein
MPEQYSHFTIRETSCKWCDWFFFAPPHSHAGLVVPHLMMGAGMHARSTVDFLAGYCPGISLVAWNGLSWTSRQILTRIPGGRLNLCYLSLIHDRQAAAPSCRRQIRNARRAVPPIRARIGRCVILLPSLRHGFIAFSIRPATRLTPKEIPAAGQCRIVLRFAGSGASTLDQSHPWPRGARRRRSAAHDP